MTSRTLGLEGTKELFDYLVAVPWNEADTYVRHMLENLNDDLTVIEPLVQTRLISGLSYLNEGSPAYQGNGLLLP